MIEMNCSFSTGIRPKKSHIARALFLALLMCSASSLVDAVTPATLHVGDGVVDGSILEAYDNAWLISVRYDDGRHDERGLSSDHVRFRDIDGKKYLTRIEGSTSIVGKLNAAPLPQSSTTFNVFDPVTLQPSVGDAYSSAGDRVQHHFDGLHVATKSRIVGQNTETSSEISLPEPVYDFNGGMTGLLLATLPLKVGYRAVLPVLGDEVFGTEEIRVVREEVIRAGYHGKVKTFVVAVGSESGRSTYWIRKTKPFVMKVQIKYTNAVATWECID